MHDSEWINLKRLLVPHGWTEGEPGLLFSSTGGLFVAQHDLADEEDRRAWLFASIKRRLMSAEHHIASDGEDALLLSVRLETQQLWDALLALGRFPDLSRVAPDLK